MSDNKNKFFRNVLSKKMILAAGMVLAGAGLWGALQNKKMNKFATLSGVVAIGIAGVSLYNERLSTKTKRAVNGLMRLFDGACIGKYRGAYFVSEWSYGSIKICKREFGINYADICINLESDVNKLWGFIIETAYSANKCQGMNVKKSIEWTIANLVYCMDENIARYENLDSLVNNENLAKFYRLKYLYDILNYIEKCPSDEFVLDALKNPEMIFSDEDSPFFGMIKSVELPEYIEHEPWRKGWKKELQALNFGKYSSFLTGVGAYVASSAFESSLLCGVSGIAFLGCYMGENYLKSKHYNHQISRFKSAPISVKRHLIVSAKKNKSGAVEIVEKTIEPRLYGRLEIEKSTIEEVVGRLKMCGLENVRDASVVIRQMKLNEDGDYRKIMKDLEGGAILETIINEVGLEKTYKALAFENYVGLLRCEKGKTTKEVVEKMSVEMVNLIFLTEKVAAEEENYRQVLDKLYEVAVKYGHLSQDKKEENIKAAMSGDVCKRTIIVSGNDVLPQRLKKIVDLKIKENRQK